MDSAVPSDKEMQNCRILQAISEKYNIRIALPRASQSCARSPKQICWGRGFDAIELSLVTNTIKTAKTICKLPSKNILIGFSNGAYALNKLFRQCLTSKD